MNFENLIPETTEAPRFTLARFRDYNPVSQHLKIRRIGMPNDSMRAVHARLIRYLRQSQFQFPHATCFRKGDSAVKNVMPHCKNRHFYLVDLRNAYGAVEISSLAQILFNRDMPFWKYGVENTKTFLYAYCCYAQPGNSDSQAQDRRPKQSGVVIGAPASPVLFNIYAGVRIDEALGSLCAKHDITYTRYIDDLTFSSKKKIGARVRKLIRDIISAGDFSVHHRKARVVDLRKQASVLVTGVGLTHSGRMFLPRSYLYMLRGLIHKALTDKRITRSMVEGRMGVFKAIMQRRALNRTEQKLFELYRQWRSVAQTRS